ncbi:hypothetical protein RJ53_07755 [Methanocalculus chunghsingensis]|uniref:Nmd3 N-terminal domain-containing protein n=1 Tax=Methanocalculus chunghsingensis TaxID=156457 RepID=A0A8J7WAI7_9EURY|nr:60S ribosomal export protein NMD3 [Methanocalculus chunghsingensis]MBR1369392.1 hypothetical protein [Methanocalculus chunghsingensis]
MSIQQTICPRCGEPSEEGLCGSCRLHEIEWVTISPRVQTILCPTCGSRKVGSSWSDCQEEREELGRSLVLSGIELHPDVKNPEIEMDLRDISSNRTQATLTISARCYDLPVSRQGRVLIVWGKEQCDRCCRISGSYYEGTIQVRAEGRKPSEWEVKRCAEIAYQAEDMAQQGGERLAFVSSMETSRDGLDIIVSSLGFGQSIVNDITSLFGAKTTSHPKLIGEKEGKRLYRVTWLIRLPRIIRGNVIEIQGRYYQVTGSDGQTLRTRDLLTSGPRTFRDEPSIRVIAHSRDAMEAMVTHQEGSVIGILDPKTQMPAEIAAPEGCRVPPGGVVHLLRDGDTLFVVGY